MAADKHTYSFGTLLMITAAAAWGVGDVLIKSVFVVGVNLPFNLALLRLWVAILLYVILLASSRILKKLHVPWRNLILPFALGTMIAAFTAFFLSALALTTVASTTLLVYTSPAFVVLLGRVTLKEKLTKSKLFGVALSLLGVGTVVGLPLGAQIFTSKHYLGDIFALITGLANSGMFIIGRMQSKVVDERITIFYASLFACLILTPIAILVEGLNPLRLAPASPYALGAALATSFAFLPYLAALKRIEATKASIYGLTEPIVASVIAALALGEMVDLWTIVGGGLILAAALIVYGGR